MEYRNPTWTIDENRLETSAADAGLELLETFISRTRTGDEFPSLSPLRTYVIRHATHLAPDGALWKGLRFPYVGFGSHETNLLIEWVPSL